MQKDLVSVDVRGCYCGNEKPYDVCCAPFHHGKCTPQTPEELMRSRFSAFANSASEYLVATMYPSKVNQGLYDELKNTLNDVIWFSLSVVDTGLNKDKKSGFVEFVAFYRGKNADATKAVSQLHEKSQFIKEQGKWFYLDGEMMPALKLGRNDLCWCGSKKKLKKCHSM